MVDLSTFACVLMGIDVEFITSLSPSLVGHPFVAVSSASKNTKSRPKELSIKQFL
jgi:hypothetical protein